MRCHTDLVLPVAAERALATWLDVHDRVAPGLIEGLYAVGSIALDDWQPRSDIDIVAVTADPATEADAELLELAHAEFIRVHDGPAVDGPVLAWGDLAVPPVPVLRPWTLDGEFHHDGECFEINPVTWYTLAEYGVVVRGQPAADLGVAVAVDERRAFVRENVDTYWRIARDDLARAAGTPDRSAFPAVVVEWCALGVARMLVTFETGDVASKTVAGEWTAERLPSHAALLRAAIDIRATPEPDPVDARMLVSTVVLMDDAISVVLRP